MAAKIGTASLLLAATLLGSASPSQGQPTHSFFPLENGNYWVYQFYGWQSSGYQTREVTGQIVIGGSPYSLLSIEHSDFHTGVVENATCAVRVTEDHVVESVRMQGPSHLCYLFFTQEPASPTLSSESWNEPQFWISGNEYDFQLMHTHALQSSGSSQLLFAKDVGFIAQREFPSFSYPFYLVVPDIHLVYADLGDNTVYGVHPDDYEWETMYPIHVGDERQWHYFGGSYYDGPSNFYIHLKVLNVDEPNQLPRNYTVEVDIHDIISGVTESTECTIVRRFHGNDSLTGPAPCSFVRDHVMQKLRPLIMYGAMRPDDNHPLGLMDTQSIMFGSDFENWNQQTWFDGVGMTLWRRGSASGTGNSHWSRTTRLRWAIINGQEYGNPVVSNEYDPSNVVNHMSIAVFPNPAREVPMLEIMTGEVSEHNIDLFDLLGRNILSFVYVPQGSGVSVVPLEVPGLAPGTYIVRLSNRSKSVVTRFVILD